MKSKEQKRNEAAKRLEVYNELSTEEKFTKLPPEPAANRQRQKLMLQLDNRDKKQEQSEQPQYKKQKAKDRKSDERRGEVEE